MPEKPPFPPPAPHAPARVTAAHVQAAIGRTAANPIAQAKTEASAPEPHAAAVRPVARHVEHALARAAQGKILPNGTRPAASSPTAAANAWRPQPARQQVLQRSSESSSGTISTEVGVGFQDLTDFNAIKKEILKNHGDPEQSLEVMSTITMLVWGLVPGGDTMNTWLVALNNEGIQAKKWGGSKDIIEIYPSGTHGKGKHDRLWLQVGKTQVKVLKAYSSEH